MQLAHVVVAREGIRANGAQPAQQDVAARLHQPLPGKHPLRGIGIRAWLQVALEHGALGLFDLQQEGILVVSPEQQHYPGTGADAANPDDLAGHAGVGEASDERASAHVQAPHVPVDEVAHLFVVCASLGLTEKLLDRDEQRRIAGQAATPVDHAS